MKYFYLTKNELRREPEVIKLINYTHVKAKTDGSESIIITDELVSDENVVRKTQKQAQAIIDQWLADENEMAYQNEKIFNLSVREYKIKQEKVKKVSQFYGVNTPEIDSKITSLDNITAKSFNECPEEFKEDLGAYINQKPINISKLTDETSFEYSKVKRIRRVGLRENEKLEFPNIKKKVNEYEYDDLIKSVSKKLK